MLLFHLWDRLYPITIADAILQIVEDFAFVEIRRVNPMSLGAKPLRESLDGRAKP